MKIPKRIKYKKYHRLNKSLYSKSSRNCNLINGFWGLKAVEGGKITEKQIESVRQAINKNIKPFGKMWTRVFSSNPVTSKPSEIRMGKGKGSVNRWICNIRPGQVLYEVNGVDKAAAMSALKRGGEKLPVKTVVVSY